MSILALTSNTLAGTAGAGQIEYNGQFFATDSNARGQLERITQGTAVASTSGTSIDFTGIPAWAKKITVMLNGVSTSGTSPIQIQIGAGSVTTTGYVGSCNVSTTNTNYVSGFVAQANLAAPTVSYGIIILTNISGNSWLESGVVSAASNANTTGAGGLTLGGTLDRVRITTTNGTDTFDAGSINIMYEG